MQASPALSIPGEPVWQRALNRVRRVFFGHDVFISFAHTDALEYAQELSDLLVQHGVGVYVDAAGAASGGAVPPHLHLRLRHSSLLVLIGSPGAAESAAVAGEVEAFTARGRRVLVVDVAGALDGQAWYRERVKGAPSRRITAEELAGGIPSQAVVEQVLKQVSAARREDRLRRGARPAGVGASRA